MTILHGPAGTNYRDSQFKYYFMDDFGHAVLLEGEIQEQAVNFMRSAYVYNKGDIGH